MAIFKNQNFALINHLVLGLTNGKEQDEMPNWRRMILWLGYLGALALFMPVTAWASNCSSKYDCWHVARGAAAAAAGAGVAAAAAASGGDGNDEDYT